MGASSEQLIAPGLVDSALKLRVLLLFSRYPRWCDGTASLSGWLGEDDRCVLDQELESLTNAGFLGRIEQQGRSTYHLAPSPERRVLLERLAITYDDPQRRSGINARVRAVAQARRSQSEAVAAERVIGGHGMTTG